MEASVTWVKRFQRLPLQDRVGIAAGVVLVVMAFLAFFPTHEWPDWVNWLRLIITLLLTGIVMLPIIRSARRV